MAFQLFKIFGKDKNKILFFVIGLIILASAFSFVSAADSNSLLQIWRNASTGTNVSYVDNNGNWYMKGNLNVTGNYYGNGSFLTGLNSSSINQSIVNYWIKNGNDIYYNTGKVGIGTASPIKNLDVVGSANITSTIYGSNLYVQPALYTGSGGTYGGEFVNLQSGGATGINYGVYSLAQSEGTNYGGYFSGTDLWADSVGTYGIYSGVNGYAPNQYAVYANAVNNGYGNTYGIYQNGSTNVKNYFAANVGIGTTSPTTKLDVNGDFNSTGSFYNINGFMFNVNGQALQWSGVAFRPIGSNPYLGYPGQPWGATFTNTLSTDSIIPYTTNGNVSMVSTGGYVGINTTTPQVLLDINSGNNLGGMNSAATAVSQRFSDTSSSGGYRRGISWYSSGSGSPGLIAGIEPYVEGGWGTDLKFNIRSSTGNMINPVTIYQNGNVGINKTAPETALDVYGNSEYVIQYQRAGNGDKWALGMDAGGMEIKDVTSGVIAEYLNNSGSVGIGTYTPMNKLNVVGDANITGNIYANNIYANNTYSYINATTLSSTGVVTGSGTLQYIPMWNGTTSINNSNIYQLGGNIGINTASPSYPLQVNGKIYAQGQGSGNGLTFDYSQIYDNAGNLTLNVQSGKSFNFVTGNVGIGKTNPYYALDVNGYINASNFLFNDTANIIGIGNQASSGNTGTEQVAIGDHAGAWNKKTDQVALGYYAGSSNSGAEQTVLGNDAGSGNTADYQVGIGFSAGESNTGVGEVAVGINTGKSNTGSRLIALGQSAGQGNTGNDVVAIGYQAGYNNAVANQFILKEANVNAVPLMQGDFGTGKLGINTSTPQNTLNVVGDANITGTLYANTLSVTSDSVANLIVTNNATVAKNLSVSGNALFVNNNTGNVGIGTTSPLTPLHVNGTGDTSFTGTGNYGLMVESSSANENSYAVLGFTNPSYTTRNWANARIAAKFTSTGSYLNFGTTSAYAGGVNNIAMTINPSGNVGIGTTLPVTKLDVVGAINVTAGGSLNGQYDFNGGWTANGLSIINGNLYAQTGYFYNISSLQVTTLNVNGSIIPYTGFDNQFDVGSSSLRWRNIYAGGYINASTDVCVAGGNCLSKMLASGSETDPKWSGNLTNFSNVYNYVTNNTFRTLTNNTFNTEYFTINSGPESNLVLNGGIGRGAIFYSTGGVWKWEAAGGSDQYFIYSYPAGKSALSITASTADIQTGANFTTNNIYANNIYANNTYSYINATTLSSTGVVTGSGTLQYIPMWNGTTSINNSNIYQLGGNIGINTASPSYPLQVNGKIYAQGQGSGNGLTFDYSQIYDNAGNLTLNVQSGKSFNFVTGNVGIGTTSPGAKLEVQGVYPQIIAAGSLGNQQQLQLAYNPNTDVGYIQAIHEGVAYTPLILQPAGGNVGIGTSTPQNTLNVVGDANVTGPFYVGKMNVTVNTNGDVNVW